MAKTLLVSIGLAMAVMAMLSPHVSAQTSGCMTTIVSLSSCLNYITGNSSTPSSSCCSTLSSVVKNEPQCLCVLLNGGASSLGVTINTTKALELPPACKVQTPPVSLCKKNAIIFLPSFWTKENWRRSNFRIKMSSLQNSLGAPAAAPSASTETPSSGSTPSSTSSTPSVPSASTAGSKTTPSTTGESSDSMSNKSAVISIFFLAISAFASLI
ncbi:Bifunctional inhibitor/lipid-transfer protein/seed storage 2S albumin superfamily protein [Rhynchospora pubera]|uniref:Bifunctional inhibitor/lipid-transfer protein/seed storage 2S albumin superfamily protein n=1 Tax=Rhynchospora pubera TaxID=906938 RepID=A0AAV8H2E8_9POAL|nr:Bifunctional inhibitor/lipid-transfer protein/seed storage 2S albumin superfamily protein [Rhynchospora pubera]